MPAPEDTDLLLVHADELDPVLEGPVASANASAELSGTGYEDPEHLWDESREANELAAQRWGVIAPEGPVGDELLGRIERLIARRQEQQDAKVSVYRVPSGMSAAEVSRWRKDHFEGPNVRRRDLPRYQLILGELDQVSAELQMMQGSDGYVGRLAFDDPEHYEAYVDKLLRWEQEPSPSTRARAVFHTVQDRTSATTVGHQSLMLPGLELARRDFEQGEFPASQVIAVDHGYTPKPGPLIEEAIKDDPAVLFTISHGAGAPRQGWRSTEEQRRLQGGMSFGRSGGLLTGEALTNQRFLPGGVWFMLACFGAGTPEASKYRTWLDQLQAIGSFSGSTESIGASLATNGRPFTAAVPKAVLASSNGPLAFIGHVDLAWTYSFRERDGGRPVDRPGRFIDVLHGLLRQDRVGVAFRELYRHYGQANTDLAALIESGEDDPERRGHLWMLRNDLAGYILLGDPAARLPLRPEVVQQASNIDLSAMFGFGVSQTPTQSSQPEPTLDVDLDALERAIGLYLVGDLGVPKILQECGLELGRREFEDLVRRYTEAGRSAIQR
ncbi:hypothetical protein [Paraliomyxa miuraensis]|uniref:hypothetical protein n=1 Tax=Paraliomyxa miuraensis TaxID=376150 RepID=UPI00225BE16E|nr:hypothetical protein [Paraliomyxa miuraensis]MCX4247180.1 hypothetical protein [Paraliomyxa miuraensis]